MISGKTDRLTDAVQPPVARWTQSPIDAEASARLVEAIGCSPLVADLLVRRGVDSAGAAATFLEPRLAQLHDPSTLPGLEAAVTRLTRAVGEGERIVVFGDYDVDGLSSTALLCEFFRFLGCDVAARIPDRLRDGYGLGVQSVRELAAAGFELIVTVDNGSTAIDAARAARDAGVDLIIVDHHLPGETLPPAVAVVNPWVEGSEYPFPKLAGVGVTFKLVWAICQRLSKSKKVSDEFREFMLDGLAYVALGTVADVVPLVEENRVLVHFGLMSLQATRRPGLRELAAAALRGERGKRNISATDIAFRVAPRLNAAGRLGDAQLALDLLLSRDAQEASRLYRKLDEKNLQRRAIEREMHEEAREQVLREFDLSTDRVLVLSRQGWHPGVIGIVASRVVDEFCRPTILISVDDEGVGKGSARSIPQISIREALARVDHCLDRYGGHAMAAGVLVGADSIDELRRCLNESIDVPPEAMAPEVRIDGEYALGLWTPQTLDEVARLAPFGCGNPEPLFALHGGCVVGEPRTMGRAGDHLSFYVRNGEKDVALRAVAFGRADCHAALLERERRVSLLYQPQLNTWGGRESVELHVRDLLVD